MPFLSDDTNSSTPFFFSCQDTAALLRVDQSQRSWGVGMGGMKGTEAGSYIKPVYVDMACRDPQCRRHAFPEPTKMSGVQPPHVHRQVLRRDGEPRYQRAATNTLPVPTHAKETLHLLEPVK